MADSQLRANLAHATTTIRAKRARAVAELADWEELRAAGQAIKDHTLAHLDHYLVRLEENVTAAGGHVHWAQDAGEANAIVAGLVRAAGRRFAWSWSHGSTLMRVYLHYEAMFL